jgi:zinc transporter ZupT
MLVPLGGGLLLGVAIFGLLPELAGDIGWAAGLPLFAAGYLMLFTLDRYGYPVCPSCSHDHDHGHCEAPPLHGFVGPLVAATALHAFLDGWGLASASNSAAAGLRLSIPLAVLIHKIPEGLALGSILRASTSSRAAAFGGCVIAEGATLAGGAAALAAAPRLGDQWIGYPLAVAGGCFIFLGFHAIHGEWKRRGAGPAFVPALTGAAAAAALQQGVRVWFR